MRLIDADALMVCRRTVQTVREGTLKDEIAVLWDDVKEQPTVDAVPVIHCKDCKYVGTDATCCFVCNRPGMGLRPFHVYHDDFCSYADRRKHDGVD